MKDFERTNDERLKLISKKYLKGLSSDEEKRLIYVTKKTRDFFKKDIFAERKKLKEIRDRIIQHATQI